MKRLAIAHTESSLGWGGQELRILSESKGMQKRGHEITLLCPPEARIYSEAPAWGIKAVPLPIGKKRFAGLRALMDWFRANPQHLVSAHSSTDSWLSALALLTLGRPFPMVRTRHISAPVPRNPFTRWLYQRATRRIVTTGEALKQALIERNGYDAARIDSVPTGIDAGRFRPGDRAAARRALGVSAHAKIIGIVATLRSWKGHLHLIEAVAGLPEDVQLLVVGDGPMHEVLVAKAVKAGLAERTRFAGNQADVVPWLHAMDIFALPSYANEGVPQSLVQAMLAGLPCVTTGIGGIPELAEHEVTALVVPPQDPAALKAALARLLADDGLRTSLTEAARRRCVERFSYERMIERMEEIYLAVAQNG